VYIELDESQRELRDELRDYYEKLLNPEVRAEMQGETGTGPKHREVVRKLGADGWIAMGWPEEYGGQAKSAIEQFIFYDETMRIGSPAPMLTINTVGPTIMDYGTEEQKQFFLPKIAAGELHFCIGYSEPDAGTDLAALATKAVRDGDEYIINGQKTWTSLAQGADYIWLAARTNPDVSKHAGISLFAIPMDTPGISLEPLSLLSTHNINHTFFDDVRVPASCIIGEEDQGWSLITSQLNRERVSLCSSGIVERVLDQTADWARRARLSDGRKVIDQPWVKRNLALVTAKLEALKLLNWNVAWTVATSNLDVADSSAMKVYGTEFYVEAFRLLMQVHGEQAYVVNTEPEKSSLEMLYRSLVILTFGGGTNELQRDLISMFGLGFPKADR
jgi:alkylation response protein AidB-like acyl-CoA dehydrogenase